LFNTGATSVMSRGNRREDIFHDDVDREDFVKTLAEARQKAGWQVHAYCLMRNHRHLVVETPDGNLVAGMRWLLSACAFRLNNRHKLFGHVFDKNHSGDLPRESRDAKAGRIAREELRRLGWVEADLSRRPKNDPAKLALAARLRRETTATIKEIAARVKLGTSKSANARLYARMKNPARDNNAK
jgi:REP element-mobilizing transposase RayT